MSGNHFFGLKDNKGINSEFTYHEYREYINGFCASTVTKNIVIEAFKEESLGFIYN